MFQQSKAPGYMQELDAWLDNLLSELLVAADRHSSFDIPQSEGSQKLGDEVVRVKTAIREKVLESYHNGQAAGPARGRRYDKR